MNIPQRWLDVLRALQAAGFTEAFIGGGALRDLDNGQAVKDVDIFVRHRGFDTFAMIEQVFGYGGTDQTQFNAEYKITFPDVMGVYEFLANPPIRNDWTVISQGDPLFNIIACSGPAGGFPFLHHHLERFDLGICRIAHDGVVAHVHSAYNSDKTNRTITIVNPVRLEKSIERAKRIRDRAYTGWTIILPGGSSLRTETYEFDDPDLI